MYKLQRTEMTAEDQILGNVKLQSRCLLFIKSLLTVINHLGHENNFLHSMLQQLHEDCVKGSLCETLVFCDHINGLNSTAYLRFLIMFTLRVIIIITTVIVPLNYELCFCGCSRAEYEISKQCCPMCPPGNHVHWHCTDDTSTTCVPCPEFTFIDEPNGLTKCFPCTVCDASQGLRVNKACTRSSNTVCEPIEGFYCTDKTKGSCILALKHSKCSPGKYIKQAGTASTDTVCAHCIGDTYSNGSFSSCLAHTKCETLGLIEVDPGTHTSDTECGNSSSVLTLIAITVTVILLVLLCVTFVCIWKKKLTTNSGRKQFEHYRKKSNLETSSL